MRLEVRRFVVRRSLDVYIDRVADVVTEAGSLVIFLSLEERMTSVSDLTVEEGVLVVSSLFE